MVRVLHITDTHIAVGPGSPHAPKSFADAAHALNGRSTTAATNFVLDHAFATTNIDLILHTGDVVDEPTAAAYSVARSTFTRPGIRLLATPGNHDGPGGIAGLNGETGPCIDIGAWRVVVACSARPGEASGTFSDDGLQALDESLATDRPTLIGVHHPPVSACAHPECTITNVDAFFAVIDRHPNVRAVVSGHLHLAAERGRNGVRYLLGPSACLQLIHVHPIPENNRKATPIGARLLDLHDDGSLTESLIWAPAP